jgi:hypothetical protein
MNSNHVGALYPDQFGNIQLGSTNPPVPMGSTGNAIATISTIGTNYIVRRITASNANGSVALANVTIFTSNDGNLANAVSNAVVLSNITATTKYQDLNLTANTATTILSGSLFVCVNTAAAANNTVDITVYGDVVTL